MRRTSITSAISSIPEVDSLGFSASHNGVIFEDGEFKIDIRNICEALMY